MAKAKIREVEEVALNLIPIMNLFTAMIPFLLLAAAFFQLSIVKITIPVTGDETGETDIAKEEDKITLQLDITGTSFEMAAASDTLAPEVVSKLRDRVPRVADADKEALIATYKAVTDAAYRLKGKYAASDTVIVTPDPEIPYEVVVSAIDAVRVTTIERGRDKLPVELFPRVVLSTRLK